MRDHLDEFPQREKTVWAGLLKGLLCCRVDTWSSGETGKELGHFATQLRGRVPLILHAGGPLCDLGAAAALGAASTAVPSGHF